MSERVTEATLQEFEAFIQQHPKGNFAQSCLWISRNAEGEICGAMSVLIRTMPVTHRPMVYGCRAPVCDLDDPETLRDLLDGVKQIAEEEKAYVIKIDPDVPSSDERFAGYLREYGFRSIP